MTDIPTVSYLALLRHRDFAWLWAAQVASLFGDKIANIQPAEQDRL